MCPYQGAPAWFLLTLTHSQGPRGTISEQDVPLQPHSKVRVQIERKPRDTSLQIKELVRLSHGEF